MSKPYFICSLLFTLLFQDVVLLEPLPQRVLARHVRAPRGQTRHLHDVSASLLHSDRLCSLDDVLKCTLDCCRPRGHGILALGLGDTLSNVLPGLRRARDGWGAGEVHLLPEHVV